MALSRRDFLKVAASAGVVAGACGAAAVGAVQSSQTPWRLRLATSSIQFKTLSLAQACERIGKLGFEAIDIWDEFGGNTHLAEAEKLGAEGLKKLLAQHRLKLQGFSVYRAGYPKYAPLLGAAGGGVAVRGSQNGKFAPAGLAGAMKKFLESLKPEIELAEKHDSYLAIENHGNALLHTLDSFKAFVDLNRSPRLGLAVAPYHLQSAKVDVPETIRVCGGQLFFFYAWQNAPELGQLPGIGPADMKPWLAALAEIKYQGYVNPFMHHEPAPEAMAENLGQALKYLRTLA